MAIDYFRSTSYRTAALLTFFIPDERIAYTLSFLLSVLVQYVLLFIIGEHVFVDQWIALLSSLLFIFWFKIIIYYNFSNGFKDVWLFVKKRIINTNGDTYFDQVNDNFRFLIMGTAGIYAWLTLLIILSSDYFQFSWLLFAGLSIYFFIIPFVYPSLTLVSVILLSGNFIHLFFKKDNIQTLNIFFGAGGIAILFLFLSRVISKIKLVINSNMQVLGEAHVSVENYELSFKAVKKYLLKSSFFYLSILFILLSVLVINDKIMLISFILLVVFFAKILGFIFKKNSVIDRFVERGTAHYYCFSIIVISLLLYQKGIAFLFNDNIIVYCTILLVSVLPLIGCIKMAFAFQKAGSFYLPKEEWDVYKYIKKSTFPRSMVMAFSYSNLQLLPVYTHANLYIRGAEWMEKPEDELLKYIRALKYININPDLLLEYFNDFFKIDFPFNLNFQKENRFHKAFHLITTLIYYPHVKKVFGVKLSSNDNKSWNPDFINHLRRLIKNQDNKLLENEIDYILINKTDFKSVDSISGFKIMYSNNNYFLFGKSSPHY